jgi:hypothetical protein
MVLYIEACESGSMFEDLLPENINGINLSVYVYELVKAININIQLNF